MKHTLWQTCCACQALQHLEDVGAHSTKSIQQVTSVPVPGAWALRFSASLQLRCHEIWPFLAKCPSQGTRKVISLGVSVNISPCEAACIPSSLTRGLAWKGTFDFEDGFGFVLVLSLDKLLCQSSVKTSSLKPVCGKLVPVKSLW